MEKNPGRLVFDGYKEHQNEKVFELGAISQDEWIDFYPDACESLPRYMPQPLGKSVLIRTYVDANHAGNLANSCLLYTSPSPRDRTRSRMPSSA